MNTMKRFISVVCAAGMAVSLLAGCSSQTDGTGAPESSAPEGTNGTETASGTQGAYIPGTYTGSGSGMHGPVTATITVDENGITAVELDVSGEDADRVGEDAAQTLQEQILEAQSAEIDGVSGATVTSDAVSAAVADALNQAGGNGGGGQMTAGTYTAAAHGAKHDLTVEVTVSETAIEAINVVESDDSPYVSEAAIRILPQRIIDNQSVAVDAVAGATITSSAILSAVSDCLVQAGASLGDWSAETEITPGEDVTVDVLVVGGGTSGSTAALAAKTDSALSDTDSGLDVMIVEANGYIGGNMAICGGYIASYFGTSLNEETGHSWTADTLVDSLEELYPEYGDVINDSLMRNLAELTDDTLNGLMARGFYLTGTDAYLGSSSRLVAGEAAPYTTSTVVADPETGERSGDNGYDIYGGGAFFGQTMTDILGDAGVEIRYETTATSLIMEDGACTGVTVQDHEHSYNIYADKIILATGYAGFDDETISMYLPEVYGNVIGAETAANQSFAQKQISGLGGEVNDVHEAISDGHIVLGYNSTLAHYGEEHLLYSSMPGMFVNTEGQRFADETDRGAGMAMTIAQLGGKAYMIFDSSHEGVRFYDFLASNGLAWTSDTLEGLAEEIGVSAESLTATVQQYNEDYENGGDTVFGTAAENMSPVLTAPYYAVQVNSISTGGIDIAVYTDENLNVTLTNGGEAIENLYACGGAGSGNCFTLLNIGLGSHVVGCMTSGVYAGNMAREAILGE